MTARSEDRGVQVEARTPTERERVAALTERVAHLLPAMDCCGTCYGSVLADVRSIANAPTDLVTLTDGADR